ncbi:anion permease [Sinobaca sp. H24]|uniref:SLC13 family permease n=1 Tax=Sinobaca sp. H24 TaxID=2923376 RepID=UPI0020796542|nr:anion permease [Sinobaca sp. H24]
MASYICFSFRYSSRKTLLDKRIAYKSLALFGKSEKKVIIIFIVLGYILTFLIPNSMARLSMLLPISQGVIDSIKSKNKENFRKALILTITFVPYITTVAIITGASGSIYAAGLFEATLDYQWGYLYWLLLISPITIFTLIILWFSLNYWFPLNNAEKMNTVLFHTKLNNMGKVKKTEKKLIAIYLVLILGWVTNEWHTISISMVSLVAMIILFLPGIEIIKWEEARKEGRLGSSNTFCSWISYRISF